MALRIDLDVLSAILAGSTSVSRRLEIYESDGSTLWLPITDSSRIIDGSVSVEYGRSERRSFDLTLDNSDGLLDHDPRGFWYDKVIKIYRGVNFRNSRLKPKIMIIRDQLNFKIAPVLRRLDYTDITDRTGLTTTLDDMYDYDLVIGNSGDQAFTAGETVLLKAANDAGFNVLTVGSANTSTTLPVMISTTNAKATGGWGVSQITTTDSPFVYGWSNYALATGSASDQVITAYPAGVTPAATFVVASVNTYPALFYSPPNGTRWFHYQPRIIPNENAQVTNFLSLVMGWLYTYASNRAYETQIGEFLIDSIETENFPSHIKISGRDYAKRLVNSMFRNTVTFAAGTPLDRLVADIAAGAGVYKNILYTNNAVLAADLTFEKKTPRWDVLEKIHNDKGFEIFFNAQGYLVTRPMLDPTLSPIAVTLQTGGTAGNLASFSKTSTDAEVRNVVIVSGENQTDLAGGNIWQGIAENTAGDSPTRIAKLGPREYFYTTAFVKSNAECLTLANQMLKIKALESFDLSFSSLVFPWLEVGEIAQFVDPNPSKGEPARYLLTQLAIPLGLGPMTGTGKRITIVSNSVDSVANVAGLSGDAV